MFLIPVLFNEVGGAAQPFGSASHASNYDVIPAVSTDIRPYSCRIDTRMHCYGIAREASVQCHAPFLVPYSGSSFTKTNYTSTNSFYQADLILPHNCTSDLARSCFKPRLFSLTCSFLGAFGCLMKCLGKLTMHLQPTCPFGECWFLFSSLPNNTLPLWRH